MPRNIDRSEMYYTGSTKITKRQYQQQRQQHLQKQEQNTYQPRGLVLASAGYDSAIRLWHVEKGYCERLIQNPDNSHVNALTLTPGGDLLASAGFQNIRLYDIEKSGNNPLINFEGISKNVSSIGFSTANNFMYTGGEDFHARIWDVRARRLHCQRKCALKTPINSVFLHPNQIEIYIADQSGSIWIWNIQNDNVQRLFVTNDGFIQHIAYDKECRLLAAIDTLGKCYIFRNTSFYLQEMLDEKNGEMTASGYLHRRLIFQAHSKYGLKCCFSPDSTLLATTSADTTVKFWRTSDLSIVNSSNTIQIDDPSDNKVKKKIETPVTGYEQFLKYKQLWSTTEDVGMEFDPAAVAMLGAPFLARLFPWKKIKPVKPPPCYLKRRRRRCMMTNSSSGDLKQLNYRKSSGNGGKPTHCTRCHGHSKLRHFNSFSILQPNMNALCQLSWTGKKKNSLRLSHTDPLNSPVKGCSNHSKKNVLADNLVQSSLNDLKQYEKEFSQQQHHHPHCGQMYPSLYQRYFSSDYDDLTSKLDDSISNSNQNDLEDISLIERQEDEDFLRIIKSLSLVDSDFDDDNDADEFDYEDDDSYGNDKETNKSNAFIDHNHNDPNVISRDTSNGGIEEDANDAGDNVNPPSVAESKRNYVGSKSGRSKSATNSRSNSSSRSSSRVRSTSNECCCSCDCFTNNTKNQIYKINTTGLGGDDDDEYGTSNQDELDDDDVPKKPKQKNEWSLTEQIAPIQVLKRHNQKWVWDLAFSADSQYVFTASSDHFVRLWSVYTGQMTREYSGHQKAVTTLAFSDLFVD